MQEQLTSRSWGGHSDSRASPMPEGALASARPWSAVSDIRASPMSSLHHSAQILPLRHIPVVLPAEVGGAVYGTPSVENHPRRQYPQAFEYLNITDVDALRSMIEKLVDDAEQFTADIRRKDHIITDLQVKVLSLEGHLDTAGMHQNQIASKFEALQRMHEEEIQRVLRDFDEQTAALKQAQAALYDAENRRRELETRLEEAARLTEELDYVKAQALHHAKYRDEALKQCDKLKLMVSAADAENFSLKKDIEITKRNLASAEDNAVTLNEMLHQEREINAEFRYTSV
jgi:chaperonin cofactor prefoldin